MPGTRRDYSAEGDEEWGIGSTREEGSVGHRITTPPPPDKDGVYKKDIPKWVWAPEWAQKGVVGCVNLLYGGMVGECISIEFGRLKEDVHMESNIGQDIQAWALEEKKQV